MPDQPADPIHYEMKIPPEPKDAPLNSDAEQQETQKGSDAERIHRDGERRGPEAEHRGSDDVTAESNRMERGGASGDRK